MPEFQQHDESGQSSTNLGYQIKEEEKKMQKLKRENYELRLQIHNYKQELAIFKDGRAKSSESLNFQSKLCNPDEDFLDHKKYDTTISSDEDGTDQNELIRKYEYEIETSKKSSEKLSEELKSAKEKCKDLEQQNSEILLKLESKNMENLDEINAFAKNVKEKLSISNDTDISFKDLGLIFENNLTKNNQNLEKLESLNHFTTVLYDILNIALSPRLGKYEEEYLNEKSMDLKKIVKKFSKNLTTYDTSNLSKIIDEFLKRSKEIQPNISQYPLSQLNDNVSQITQEISGCDKFIEPRSENEKSICPKRISELKNHFQSISIDFSKSISNLKSEISIIEDQHSTRISQNSVNNSISTSMDASSTVFDKSDIQYSKIKTLMIRLEELVEQNDKLQIDMVKNIENVTTLEAKVKEYSEKDELKNERIQRMTVQIDDISQKNDILKQFSEKIQTILGCSENELESTVDSIQKVLESVKQENQNKDTIINELNKSVQSLEEINKRLEEKITQQDEKIEILENQLKIKLVNDEKESKKNDEMQNKDQEENSNINSSIIKSCHDYFIKNRESISWSEWESKFDNMKLLTKSTFEVRDELVNIFNKMSDSKMRNDTFSEVTKTPSILTEETHSEIVKLEQKNSELTMQIDTLTTQIELLNSELYDKNDQIESLKITNSLNNHTVNPNYSEIIEEMQKLQEILQRSYDNNKNLREYLSKLSKSSSAFGLPSKLSSDFKVIAKKEIDSSEKSIQDSLSILKNLAKFVKNIEDIKNENPTIKSQIELNIHKAKKMLKLMQKNTLKLYRTLINAEYVDSSFIAEQLPQSNEKEQQLILGKTKEMIEIFEKMSLTNDENANPCVNKSN